MLITISDGEIAVVKTLKFADGAQPFLVDDVM